MKKRNVTTKTFAPKGNVIMGTRSVHIGKKPDGRYLVYISTFEEDYGILRTKNKNDAINHANKLIKGLEDRGYKLIEYK